MGYSKDKELVTGGYMSQGKFNAFVKAAEYALSWIPGSVAQYPNQSKEQAQKYLST